MSFKVTVTAFYSRLIYCVGLSLPHVLHVLYLRSVTQHAFKLPVVYMSVALKSALFKAAQPSAQPSRRICQATQGL